MTAEAIVRKGRKFDQVLEGALEVFLRDGFEGASVDDIARVSGVSKATLYSYFPDKKLLFVEAASALCRRQADEALATFDMTSPPREVLPRVAHTFLDFIFAPIGQAMFRMCVAESDRFPNIGQSFYENGPMVMRSALSQYLMLANARGELQIDDMDLAADQFAELCKADLWPKLIFGIQASFAPDEIRRIVDGAVETFMARYGA